MYSLCFLKPLLFSEYVVFALASALLPFLVPVYEASVF